MEKSRNEYGALNRIMMNAHLSMEMRVIVAAFITSFVCWHTLLIYTLLLFISCGFTINVLITIYRNINFYYFIFIISLNTFYNTFLATKQKSIFKVSYKYLLLKFLKKKNQKSYFFNSFSKYIHSYIYSPNVFNIKYINICYN